MPSERGAPGRPLVDALEPRVFRSDGAAAGPVVVGSRLLGNPLAVTGLVVTFSEPLDPARAADARAYGIFLSITKSKSVNGDADGGFTTETFTDRAFFAATSAAYDEAARSVTITPDEAFPARRARRKIDFYVRLATAGTRPVGLQSAAGVPLDGDRDGQAGGDAFLSYAVRGGGRRVDYRDADGDLLRLRLRGPGRVFFQFNRYLKPAGGQLFVLNTDPARSVLTGSVKRGKAGDGTVLLQEVVGANRVQTTLLSDPALDIRRVTDT